MICFKLVVGQPLSNDKTLRVFTSLNLAILNLCVSKIRNYYFKYKQRFFTGKFPPVVENLRNRSLLTDLRLLRNLREALSFLDAHLIIDKEFVGDLINEALLNKKMVLVLFAHFQPEATTFPEGNTISNHIDLISKIRSGGYIEPILYLEHPSTRVLAGDGFSYASGTCRSTDYYNQLKNLGCYFVDHDSLSLGLESVLPLTISGTIALERSLQGFHTIVAGNPWFIGMPGIIILDTFLDERHDKWREVDGSVISELSFSYLDILISEKSLANITGVGGFKHEFSFSELEKYRNEFISFILQVMETHESQR